MSVLENGFHVFLGGADLEMQAIAELTIATLGRECVHDRHLRWGAKASSYSTEIEAILADGGTVILVELELDLPGLRDASRVIVVDHHGDRAGVDRPSALRQVFELLGLPEAKWSRQLALIEANDIGHIPGLVAAGATPAEIADIRARDRAAQGVTPETERLSREAVAQAQLQGRLTIVETRAETSSVIVDLMAPELGGPGAENLLVLMPSAISFFGDGSVIKSLSTVPGSWRGGALPDRGYWGVNAASEQERQALALKIRQLIHHTLS